MSIYLIGTDTAEHEYLQDLSDVRTESDPSARWLLVARPRRHRLRALARLLPARPPRGRPRGARAPCPDLDCG